VHEHGLAKELWPQLRDLAAAKGFRRVTRVDLVAGMLHGVSAEFLAHSLGHAFEGSPFAGAEVNIRIVEPGQARPQGPGGPDAATGWELSVERIEGQR